MTERIFSAYVSAHEVFDARGASDGSSVTYSGYLEGETPSENLALPEFPTLAEAIACGPPANGLRCGSRYWYFLLWAGVGHPPDGLAPRDVTPRVESLDRESNSCEPSDRLRRTRRDHDWSVSQLAAASGVSSEAITKMEFSQPESEDRLEAWVKFVCALEGRRRRVSAPRIYAVRRGDWIQYPFDVTESSSNS
jgi:hypothetical protein